MTVDSIIDGILARELPPGATWAQARAALHPADRGGWTRGGITARRWADYKGWTRSATRAELDALTEDDARSFYAHLYVRPFEEYPDPLRLLLIDFGVTSSHLAVFRALQRALRDQGLYAGRIDGIVGPQTRAALAQAHARRLYVDTLDHRRRYYLDLAQDAEYRDFLRDHPTTQAHNLAGWNNRCWAFVDLVPDRP